MEVFVAVVELGSLTAAAAHFDMSAVMAGKHIKALEERLGLSLMMRTTRRQSLTEAGQQYFLHCKSVLAEIRLAEQGVEALRATPRGHLRVTSSVSYGSMALAPVVAEYLATHSDVSVELVLSDDVEDIVAAGYDLALRIGEPADSGLVARQVGRYTMMICAAPAYLSRMGVPATPQDLVSHQCLNLSQWSRSTGWRLGTDEGACIHFPAGRFQSNNGQALRQAALAGFGVIMQPELLLADDVRAGRLIAILQPYWPTARPISLMYPRDRKALPKLTSFVDFVVASLAR